MTEQLAKDQIILVKFDTLRMLADACTKALGPARFKFMEFWVQGLHALTAEEVAAYGYTLPVEAV